MKSRNKTASHFFLLQRGLLPLFLLVLPSLLLADDTSQQAQLLINQMSQASRDLNYDGIFVYRRGSRMDTMRLIHKSGEEGEFERMVSLTGQTREVIRDGKSVTCIFPDNQSMLIKRSQPKQFIAAQLPNPIEKIADYYEFSLAGQDRVAGRTAWLINISPKDDYRYGYQLWIDEDTKLLLKSELKDDSGWAIEQIVFTHLEVLDSVPDELLKPSISGQGYTWYSGSTEDMPVSVSKNGWQVKTMPAGFSQSDHEIQALAENTLPVEHMVYSDGLALVSVFIEKVDNPAAEANVVSRRGGINTYATYNDGYQITAVGEVPGKTVELMAKSVVLEK